MNRVRDYAKLEREFITGTMSLRELCRRHGVTAHSAVMLQARKGGWAEKRETYRSRTTDRTITCLADGAAVRAAREIEVRDRAIDTIDKAILRLSADLDATRKELVNGESIDVPVVTITPCDVAILIDRLQVLFGRPAQISEGRTFAARVTSDAIPMDALQEIVELTRGLATPRDSSSVLPYIRDMRSDSSEP